MTKIRTTSFIGILLVICASGCSLQGDPAVVQTPKPAIDGISDSNSVSQKEYSGTAEANKNFQSQVVTPEKPKITKFDVINRLLILARKSEPLDLKYSRDEFKHWVDEDGDGCDTRKEVLIEEASVAPRILPDCKLSGGLWFSQYDDVEFGDDSKLDIDHMVPLKEAWVSGAALWSALDRESFANDLDFAGALIAVSASSNRSKGDRDPSKWLPENSQYTCTYLETWLAVKIRWNLSVDQLEATAIAENSKSCDLFEASQSSR